MMPNVISKLSVALAMLIGFAASSAQATPITVTYDFSASGFSNSPPTDPVEGSITVTFDPTVTIANQSAGITLNSLNIALDSAIEYSYVKATDRMFFGGANAGVSLAADGTNDFAMSFTGASTTPVFDNFFYTTTANISSDYAATTGSVTIVANPSAAPEPASLLVLGSALAGLALTRRSRVRKVYGSAAI